MADCCAYGCPIASHEDGWCLALDCRDCASREPCSTRAPSFATIRTRFAERVRAGGMVSPEDVTETAVLFFAGTLLPGELEAELDHVWRMTWESLNGRSAEQ
jgi:hypothetical protein